MGVIPPSMGFRALVDSYDTVDEILHRWLKPKQNNGVNRLSTGAGFLLHCIMVVCPSSFMGFCGYTGYVLELLTMLSLVFFLFVGIGDGTLTVSSICQVLRTRKPKKSAKVKTTNHPC